MVEMFSAAVFDMDGLLIDSERGIMNAWIAAASEQGIALLPTDYVRIIGRSLRECHAMLAEMLGGDAAFHEIHPLVKARLTEPRAEALFPLKSGARELLGSLAQAGIPCAVASSSARQEIESRLDRVGVLPFFQAVAGGDEVARGKPDPAVYRLAAERLGASSERCLAFEDSENGIRAAVAANMAVIAVPDLKMPTDEVAALSLKVLGRLDDALAHVPVWFGAHANLAA